MSDVVCAAAVLPGGERGGREAERGGEEDARARAAAPPPPLLAPRRLRAAPALPPLAGTSSFRLFVIHNKGFCPSRRNISKLMMMINLNKQDHTSRQRHFPIIV
jgi:hypothetical protein